MIFLRLQMHYQIYKFWFIPAIIVFWLPVDQFAQQSYQTNFYTIKDGLSSELCRSMYRDKAGFLWISTDKGLNRYDGNSFYTFKHQPGDPNSIANNSCNGMLEDSKGRLWINTDDGLSLFDHKKHTFKNYYPDKIVMPIQGISYTEMTEDQFGRIWIGGYYDVLIFDPETEKFVKSGWYDFAFKAGIIKSEQRNSITQSIKRKSKTELWLMTVYGLFSVQTTTMVFKYHPHPGVKDYFAFYIHEIDKNGTLWIGTYDQCFYTYHSSTETWKHHTCPPAPNHIPDQILKIKSFGHDAMIMLRSDGIFLYNIKTEKFSDFVFDDDKGFLSNGWYTNFEVYDNHIYFLKSDPAPFIHSQRKDSYFSKTKIPLPKGFKNNHSYITSSGKMLTGDWEKGQIAICDDQFCYILKDKENSTNLGILQLYYAASDNRQYISTSKSVYQLSEDGQKLSKYEVPAHIKSDTETEFRNFVEDRQGNIYIRERNTGIYIIRKGSQILEYFDTKISGTLFSSLYYDQFTDKIWLGTEKNGLYIIDTKTHISKNYPFSRAGNNRKAFVSDIIGDKQGNVYLLMPGRGLMYISSSDMKAKLFTTLEGMPSDAVRYGYVAPDSILWYTSEVGLMAYDPKKERFYSFDTEKNAALFNYRIFPDHNGQIAQNQFPDNMIHIDGSILHNERTNGRIYIKEVRLFGTNIAVDSILVLNYNQNNLIIGFGYLDPESATLPDLQFNINGKEWESMQAMSVGMYNLSPGAYTIKVRQRYEPGIEFDVQLVINPPWWKTIWFDIFGSIFLFGFIFWAYKKRISDIRKEEYEKNKLKQRIAEIEMTALRAQMNPHFIFNCLNSINRFILTNNTDEASEYLTKFSRLIRMILDASREDIVSLEVELEALRLYIELESMRFQDSFVWKISMDDDVRTLDIMVPPLLLQPYVENAIWHGLMQAPSLMDKKLNVNISKKDDDIKIEIIDNGIGREKATFLKSKSGDKHKSHGIALTEERLKLMQKLHGIISSITIEDLSDTQSNPCGTKVMIILNHKK